MRIERLDVKNFRCLEDITINFPDNNMAVIVGINGAGKTTILDGLKIVLSSIINQLIQPEIKKYFVLQDIVGSLTIIEQDEIYYTAESSQLDTVIKDSNEQTINVLCTAKILAEDYSESTDSKITGLDYIEQ
ncbi:MAG: AAA family ATPase, partial [Microcystaceae cyanobacterium]